MPVKIGSARLSVITGVEVKFEGVSIGDAVKIRLVRGLPEIGSLFGARKSFSRVELEGVSMSQSQIADALLGKVAGGELPRRPGRDQAADPRWAAQAAAAGRRCRRLRATATLQSVQLSGADKLLVQLSPKGSEIGVRDQRRLARAAVRCRR